MIIRARPKYLNNFNNKNTIDNDEIDKNEFYFNSGRAALKFYLNYLYINEKKVSIAMQSFNCSVVSDAALEANFKIYLLDIKLSDFSISLESVKKVADKIDVLLLTHYQGIPNLEYLEIILFCKLNHIIVIEDMAQTHGSSIDGVKVGTLGTVSIFSYAFDKPFSSFYGGKLEFNSIGEDKFNLLYYSYLALDDEEDKKSNIDLEMLSFFYQYSSKDLYDNYIDNYLIVEILLRLGLSNRMIYYIMYPLKYHIINKIINKLISVFTSKKPIQITKLNGHKIKLLKLQEKNYNYKFSNIEFIEKLCDKYGVKYLKQENLEIHWNRYSILDEKSIIKNILLDMNMQIGNYNWGITLDEIYDNEQIYIVDSLVNSHYASKNIINIPIWSNQNDK